MGASALVHTPLIALCACRWDQGACPAEMRRRRDSLARTRHVLGEPIPPTSGSMRDPSRRAYAPICAAGGSCRRRAKPRRLNLGTSLGEPSEVSLMSGFASSWRGYLAALMCLCEATAGLGRCAYSFAPATRTQRRSQVHRCAAKWFTGGAEMFCPPELTYPA